MSSTAESPSQKRAPAISMSQHDQVTSGLFAFCMLLGTTTFLLITIWIANLLPTPKRPPAVQLLEEDPGGDPHGFEDGTPGETLALGSPDVDPNAPAMAEAEEIPDTAEVSAESLDAVADVADSTQMESSDSSDSPLVNQAFAPATAVMTRPGSPFGTKGGTGRPPIGFGTGKGGFPREMRWFVKFVERGTLDEYAQQLEFFGIELGALMPDGKLILVSKLTAPRPTVRTVTSGQQEKRLYFTWKGGTRKGVDVQLFQKAGVDANNALIMHFYPPQTENQLAVLELDYKKRKAAEIKKTYFSVRSAKEGYEFTITSQTPIK
ncbi:MAG: hypothetical protein FJ302_09230 [Planctomycetes bacterium]|nr:hypothetical protein [Planctomycetota bacterium]